MLLLLRIRAMRAIMFVRLHLQVYEHQPRSKITTGRRKRYIHATELAFADRALLPGYNAETVVRTEGLELEGGIVIEESVDFVALKSKKSA